MHSHYYDEIHERACKSGLDFYRDPVSGLYVFTRLHHLKRGDCCSSGCRHCPYSSVRSGVAESADLSKTHAAGFLDASQ